MNLNALADRPAVSAIPQWVCLDPYCELMSLFEHDRKYGARLAGVLGKIRPPHSNWPTTRPSRSLSARVNHLTLAMLDRWVPNLGREGRAGWRTTHLA